MKDRQLRSIFDGLDKTRDGLVPVEVYRRALQSSGLLQDRIEASIRTLDPSGSGNLTFDAFRRLKDLDSDVYERALTKRLIIPDWERFTEDVGQIYEHVKNNRSGTQATYIPQLGRVHPDQFGVSVCTIDSQLWSRGDSSVEWTAQSCGKPVTFCMALEENGPARIDKHIGHEPSGRKFNEFALNDQNLPHNPMINAGSIMCCAMLRPEEEQADRFDYGLRTWSQCAGGRRIGFDNATYLSELSHADRNFALAYLMREKGAFPPRTDIQKTLELYFSICSVSISTETMAIVASTLAAGGVCPLTGQRIFQPETVRRCLSLMYSCGMYDYAGEFAYSVGFPAKSGVSGGIMIVIPNLMGITVWSPRLDEHGNSVRGIEFCKGLVQRYNFHTFDNLVGVARKIDPRYRQPLDARINAISEMIFAAAAGNLATMQTLVASGLSVDVADYDGRTPLHLAAAEGRLSVVEYLLAHEADRSPVDRWAATPLDEARRAGHAMVAEMLLAAGARTGQDMAAEAAAEAAASGGGGAVSAAAAPAATG